MKYTSITRPAKLRGFALIEALIAVVVLATGLLALTALQGALVRSSADSKARSQIAAYAASELDRIRTGETPPATISATPGSTDDISRTATAAGLSTLTQTYSSATYFADAGGSFATANPNTGKNAWFRRVTVNLAWTDATGGNRTLSMTTDISPLALTSSKVLVDREPNDDSGLRPIVRRLTPVTEGMIPIATGGEGGEATAATNPKPKLLGGDSGTYVSDTRYDVLTYSSVNTPPDFVRFNKKIETAVVGCTCQKGNGGFPTNGPDADFASFLRTKGYRPTYWDGKSYKTPVAAVGAVDSSPADISQSDLCDICCRDHKDPVTESGPKFSPWPGQDPLHYRLSGSSWVEATSNNDEYLEACRVIRVDGVFRVAADPKLQDNSMVPTREYIATNTSGSLQPSVSNNNAATMSRLDDDGKPLYEAYVYGAVSSGYFSASAVADVGNAIDFAALQQNSGLNNPTYVPILPSGDRRWLHSRVFVMDYLEESARTRLQKASEDCEDSSTALKKAQCVLPYLPLASINTTEVASWSPRAVTGSDVAPVPLDALASNYRNYASAKIRSFNSGLALFSAINAAEASTIASATDEQLFVQLAAAAPTQAVWLDTPSPNPSSTRLFGDLLNPMRGYGQTSAPIPFSLTWAFPTGNPPSAVTDANKANDPAATVTGSGSCTPNIAGSTSNPYACTAASTTSVEITVSGFNRRDLSNTNNATTCPGAKVPMCVVYGFTSASVNTPVGTTSTSTLVSGTAGKINEVRSFTVPQIGTTGSTVTINFDRTAPLATCNTTTKTWTYPCD